MIKGNKKNNCRNIFDSAIGTLALRNNKGKSWCIPGHGNERDTIPLLILYNGRICRQGRILEIEIELWTLQPGSHFFVIDFKTSPLNLRYSNVIHIKWTGAGVTNDRANVYFANFHFFFLRGYVTLFAIF